MIELGRKQNLKVIKKTDFGVYLSDGSEERVLLPKKQVPQFLKTGDPIEVFVYKDSSDRIIATTAEPYITVGELAILEVKEMSKIGAFLDYGLERDLLLPFKEMTEKVKEGKKYLVAMYVDRSKRLAATMKIDRYLEPAEKYGRDAEVEGTIYEINEDIGAFVAVDNKYFGLIPKKELHGNFTAGDVVKTRVTEVRRDGKLNLSPYKKSYMQMDEDSEKIVKVIEEYNGCLPYNDKASPEVIAHDFGMSKAAFKRAVGKLYKEHRIDITEKNIILKE
ncbi:MAG: S1 RNA-binding domain-containing protein [Lachnospiraceae bacterium]|nr:S1 RNA-binding domain-containing protein [Lachnospiraceae bacterium]MDE6232837.1 S1 RNA-binding domain-containing protein [Lachnospiraceae bacterium]MDE6252516.1 S1 RNA-binding domain-containing protein [Lachnospiraceae bacterium]